MDRCVAGQRDAWRQLHDRYYRLAYVFLMRIGLRGSDAEDACQEVFVQVFRYLARFEGRADFKTWLYKLCVSQAGRVRRRAQLAAARRWLLGAGMPAPSAPPEWSEPEIQRRVYAALARMKELHRAVFVLYEIEGLSGAEVAEVTGLPAATVRRRLHDARKVFEASIKEEEVP